MRLFGSCVVDMNKPIANKKNGSDLSDPKMKIQRMLKMNAVAATHAENRRTGRGPRSTTHGEYSTKNSVVTTLKVESAAWYGVSNWIPLHGQTALEA